MLAARYQVAIFYSWMYFGHHGVTVLLFKVVVDIVKTRVSRARIQLSNYNLSAWDVYLLNNILFNCTRLYSTMDSELFTQLGP
jgi:hypothetical protein